MTNSSGDKYPDAHTHRGHHGAAYLRTVEKTANGAITLEKMFAVNAGYFVFMFTHGRPGMGRPTNHDRLGSGVGLSAARVRWMFHCTYMHDHQCAVWNMIVSVLSAT